MTLLGQTFTQEWQLNLQEFKLKFHFHTLTNRCQWYKINLLHSKNFCDIFFLLKHSTTNSHSSINPKFPTTILNPPFKPQNFPFQWAMAPIQSKIQNLILWSLAYLQYFFNQTSPVILYIQWQFWQVVVDFNFHILFSLTVSY